MKTACHYAIVRFMPFVETGEFANVGVVLFAPTVRYFGFKLLGNRHGRVTGFFEQLNAKVFRTALRTFHDEMQRIEGMLKQTGKDSRFNDLGHDGTLRLWGEVVKPRETMLRFSEARMALADDPCAKVLELYQYYVERAFVTPERQEEILERVVRGWLRDARLQTQFHPGRVGNEEYHAPFPFIAGPEDKPEKIIKPLNLAYDDATRIIDHGNQWIMRINTLKKRDLLPGKVLFAVNGTADTTTSGKARREVLDELEGTGVIVAPYGQAQPIIEFARH